MTPETWFSEKTTLGAADYGIVGAVVAALFAVGWWSGRGEKTTADFFLGRRSIPAWAACLSFVATEISAMTVIGVPAAAFRENWQFVQFFIGSAAARVVVAFLFIPAFYRYDCTTIYEYLLHRFGALTQRAAAGFFLITRLLASGVRLMAACMAVSVLIGWHLIPVLALFTAGSALYIGYGGIKSVVWTNVLQALTFVAAGAATLAFLAFNIEGGVSAAFSAASAAGRLDVLNWGPPPGEGWLGKFLSDPNIVWIAALNGFFTSMAAFGTDHEMVQRLLTVETRRESQRTLLSTIAASFLVTLMFLAIGTGIFVFYAQRPELALPAALDKIYPHFTANAMPPLLRGLVLAAIVMASIDSPLASLSAAFVTDLYRPLLRKGANDRHYLWVSRVSVCVFGVLLAAIAYAFSFFDKMLWLAFAVVGVTAGSLLGVFLLGLLTERRADRSNLFAMLVMAEVNLITLVEIQRGRLALGWSWLVILGTIGTFALAWALGPALESRRGKS